MLGSDDMVSNVEGSVRVASGSRLFKLWVGPLLVMGVVLPCDTTRAAAQAPHEDYRTLSTQHFRVTFPAHLESLGRRAAGHAEVAYDGLTDALGEPGDGRIDLLVTDNSDLSNGFASIKPSRRMTVYAVPPTDGFQLAYYDDWLELVITHELAHIIHLDYTNTLLGKVGRAVFGRAPVDWPLFPEQATPNWVIEGLATWYESRLTNAGRVRGTYQEMQIRTAILEGRFEGIGEASGRSPLWPGGNRPYLYGSLLFDYLLDRYGEDRMSSFVEAVGGQWVPYRIDAAGRSAFGVSFSEAWRDWEATLRQRYETLDEDLASLGPVTEPERLTHGARWALYPTVSPDGESLVYTRADGWSDTQLRRSDPDGGESRQLARTNSLSTFDWMPDGRLVVAQVEQVDPYTTYGDLYIMDEEGGSERLTEGARLTQPSVAPDGTWAVAVRQEAGTNLLVRVDLETSEVSTLLAPEPQVHWAFPEVSPNGRWIATSRWEAGAYHDVVILDVTGRVGPRSLTQDRAIDLAPTWSPDGRWLVWSSDRTGISNVFAAEVDQATGEADVPRLLTNVRTGAQYPSVDPTGRWLYFSGYHVDGWEVERVPFAPETARVAPPVAARFAPSLTPRAVSREPDGPVEGFSSLPTLLPRYWEPLYREPVVAPAVSGGGLDLRRRELLAFGVGAETGSVDLVGRHEYSAYVQVFTSGRRAEGGLSYTFRGLGNPILSLDAGQSWRSVGRLLAGPAPDTSFVLERERGLGAAMTLLSNRWRRDAAVTVGGSLSWTAREQLDNDLRSVPLDAGVPTAPRFGDLSLSFSFSTSRAHTFQTSRTRGLTLFLQGRRRMHLGVPPPDQGVDGLDFSYDELFGRLRGYVPLWRVGHARHVLALQAGGGAAFGPQAAFGHFGVGGASGSPEDVTGFTLFGGSLVPLPLRGYGQARRFGRWAWAATAEYRFPIALVNRGLGAWPLHFDRLVGSLFTDVGNAWGPNPREDPLVSVGAELAAQLLGRYDAPLLLRAGVAVPLTAGDGVGVYVRVGLPF
jgi:Tol biopolymer transport system component